jgi:hypothetical protein
MHPTDEQRSQELQNETAAFGSMDQSAPDVSEGSSLCIHGAPRRAKAGVFAYA